MIVYKATNRINGKIYVGKTAHTLQERIAGHLRASRLSYFHKAIKKYGITSFDFSVIDTAEDESVLNQKEKYWIAYLNCKVPNGYNLTDGGEGVLGMKHSEEARARMSLTRKGRPSPTKGKSPSLETRRKISQSLTGRKQSEETARKHAQIWLGRRHTKESIQKMSASKRGKPFSAEHRKNLSLSHRGERPSRRGIKASEETKRKLSLAHMGKPSYWKGKKRPPETIAKMSQSLRLRNSLKRAEIAGGTK
jgi:group I intron endonuclease